MELCIFSGSNTAPAEKEEDTVFAFHVYKVFLKAHISAWRTQNRCRVHSSRWAIGHISIFPSMNSQQSCKPANESRKERIRVNGNHSIETIAHKCSVKCSIHWSAWHQGKRFVTISTKQQKDKTVFRFERSLHVSSLAHSMAMLRRRSSKRTECSHCLQRMIRKGIKTTGSAEQTQRFALYFRFCIHWSTSMTPSISSNPRLQSYIAMIQLRRADHSERAIYLCVSWNIPFHHIR